MRIRLSLQAKLILTLLASVAVAVGITLATIAGLLAWLNNGEDGGMLSALNQFPVVQAKARTISQEILTNGPTQEGLWSAATAPELPSSSRIQVIDMKGTIWVDTAGEINQTVATEDILTWLVSGQEAGLPPVLTEPIEVSGRLWGYYVYRPPGWESPQRDDGSGRSLQQVSGWVMTAAQGFSLLLILLLFLGFGQHLVRPVRRLSVVVRNIAEGDLTIRSSLNSRQDELGQLARDIDLMAARLQDAQDRAILAEETRRYTIAAVSHDLRTPLTAILAHTEAVLTGVTEDHNRSLAVIQERGIHMKRLIDDLFELASLDADRGPWQTRRTDVAETVREAVVGMLPQFESIGVLVEADIPEEPLNAELPSGKLERVLDNLLSNALKYGAVGGWLGVRVCLRDGYIWVGVSDRGPGIPPEEQRRIFDPFYRSDEARSGKQRGSGLGLAVAARIMERLGGRIGIDTPYGGGATFWVEVPVLCNANQTKS